MIGPAYIYKAQVTEVHDADTVTVDIDCGFDIWIRRQSLRLLGLNAPELKVDGKTNQPGYDSRNALVHLLTDAPTKTRYVFGIPSIIFTVPSPIVIETVQDKAEKYGRWLATLFFTPPNLDQMNVNEWLLDNGLAVPYMV